MAKKQEMVPDQHHNIGALNDTIVGVFQKRLKLDREIDKLAEKHIAPIKAEIKELMGTMKADTTIENKDTTLVYKLWKRQEDAKEVMDEDDGDRVQDNIKTLFGALLAGEMIDFADVVGHSPRAIVEAAEAEQASADEEAAEADVDI
jgi:thymidylate synthase